jgi:hypothetical protein
MDGVVGVCVSLDWVEKPIGCMWWCVSVAVLRSWCEMERNYKRCCFRLLILVIPE